MWVVVVVVVGYVHEVTPVHTIANLPRPLRSMARTSITPRLVVGPHDRAMPPMLGLPEGDLTQKEYDLVGAWRV